MKQRQLYPHTFPNTPRSLAPTPNLGVGVYRDEGRFQILPAGSNTPWEGVGIYFDYAATTPVDPRVRAAMEPFFSEEFGNPSSIHLFGQRASAAVFAARRAVARTIGADARELVFTGSATEANNLALRGVVRGYRDQGIGYRRMNDSQTTGTKPLTPNPYTLRPRIIVSSIEHESILESAKDLEQDGVEVVILPVSRNGIVSLGALRRALNDRTILVSVMYVNNEVGTIQPIAEVAKIIRGFRAERAKDNGQIGEYQKNNIQASGSHQSLVMSSLPLLHTDAVQAFQYLDCDVERLGVDFMTLSAHKIYGPKGIGALYVRKNQKSKIKNQNVSSDVVAPIITGGGQERDMRSGTENVPGIVGFGKAAELAAEMRVREASRIAGLRERFLKLVHVRRPDIGLNGSRGTRLPNNVNVYVPGVRAEELVMKLDLRGIAIAAGSACAARALQPSHVLRAMGYSEARARESVRITFGHATNARDIDLLAHALLE